MKSLTEITAYKCRWCGKLFVRKTHDCKFDPDKTNCLSCEKCLGVGVDDNVAFFACTDLESPSLPDVAYGCWATYHGRNNRWKMKCESYKPLPNYDGSKTYAKHLREIEEIEMVKRFEEQLARKNELSIIF